ncbi:MAG: M13 family metallopeptidase [Gemmatimonadaceae bacterium]|nr:M13 family metallopeptidase [Gemmatimonadaceae bacterium]
MTSRSMRYLAAAAALSVATAAAASAQQGDAGTFARANFDTTCAPCTDFYEYANGGWLKTHTIPPDKTSLASFGILADKNQEVVHQIVVDAASLVRSRETKPGTNDWKIGTYYMACMDTAAIDRRGMKPLQPALDAIDAVKTTDDVVRAFGVRDAGGGGRGGGGLAPFSLGPGPDPKNANDIIVAATQGGLGMSSRDDYLNDDPRTVNMRGEYVNHMARSLALIGENDRQARADADAVLAVETALARVQISRVAMRDPNATYHKMDLAEFQQMTPRIDWARYLEQQGAKGVTTVNVRTPSFFAALDSLLPAVSVKDWKAYLRWHATNSAMAALGAPFRAEAFRWEQIQTGIKEPPPRWRECAQSTNGALGEAVGQEYIARNFSPAAKARAAKMVDNLVSALRERIEGLDWMSAATKQQAVIKLDAYLRKVAYPDHWRSYASLDIRTGDYFGNLRTVAAWNSAHNWDKVGKPLDKSEWSMMPPTVNASYSPSLNQIQFPAGILQPPFFDPRADDAVNYGAIGAVIGHEMTHGFDDQGRQFDAHGDLRDWWTPEDAAKYKVAAQRVVDQFNGYAVLGGEAHVNGQLTLGENIADLGGLTVAYAAMEKALGNTPRTKIDGFTPEQRFFLAWAQIWRGLQRPQAELQQIKTNPHSPGNWRVDGPLSNMPEFKKAWGCKDGDAMVRPDSLRAVIW